MQLASALLCGVLVWKVGGDNCATHLHSSVTCNTMQHSMHKQQNCRQKSLRRPSISRQANRLMSRQAPGWRVHSKLGGSLVEQTMIACWHTYSNVASRRWQPRDTYIHAVPLCHACGCAHNATGIFRSNRPACLRWKQDAGEDHDYQLWFASHHRDAE